MALMFGEGATYDSMEGRFRTYRKEAEKLKRQAAENGIQLNGGNSGGRGSGTPRTPRSGKGGGVTKSSGKKGDSSTAKSIKANFEGTPTKNKKSVMATGSGSNEVISLDDDGDEDCVQVKDELKQEMKELLFGSSAGVQPKMEKRRSTRLFDIAQEPVNSQSNGYVAPDKPKSSSSKPVEHEKDTEESEGEESSEYEDDGMA
jgi:hypothetical protein